MEMARRAADHGIAIREANLADIDRIAEIEDASFPDPYPRGLLKAFFYMPGAYMVATDCGTIVGYTIGIIRHRTLGHLVSVAVAPGSRRAGVGRALIGETLARLADAGAKRFMLEVRESNAPALGLYKRMGFSEARKIEKYYADGESAIVMELNGSSGSRT
jgi:ribosomal-protein-alanine N-acetyltransferase